MNVFATCRRCKEKIDLNQDNFVQLNFPLQKRSVYFHFPSCLVEAMLQNQNKLSSSSQCAPASRLVPRPRADRKK